MPPKNVRTIRELIYWEYAKLIAGSAVGNRKNYAFVMHAYKRLLGRKINPSTILRENQMLVEGECCCAYCGDTESLQWEHIIPKSRGGPDTIDNMVQSCKACNVRKGQKGPFEWYGIERRYEIPRVVLGKYLKLAFDEHQHAGTLDQKDLNEDGRLDIYDLSAVFDRIK